MISGIFGINGMTWYFSRQGHLSEHGRGNLFMAYLYINIGLRRKMLLTSRLGLILYHSSFSSVFLYIFYICNSVGF
jgi:hypothetical protein